MRSATLVLKYAKILRPTLIALLVLIAAAPVQAQPGTFGSFLGMTVQGSDGPPRQALINLAFGVWKRKPDNSIKPVLSLGFVLGLTEVDANTAVIGLLAGQAKRIRVDGGNTVVFEIPKGKYVVITGALSADGQQATLTEDKDVPASGELGFFIGEVSPGFIGVTGSEFTNPNTSEQLFAYQVAIPASGPAGQQNFLALVEGIPANNPALKKLLAKNSKKELRKAAAKLRKQLGNLATGKPVIVKPPARPPAKR